MLGFSALYQGYKDHQQKFLHWLLTECDALGIDLSPPSTSSSTQSPSATNAQHSSKKKGGKGKGGKRKGPSAAAVKMRSKLSSKQSVNDFLKLANLFFETPPDEEVPAEPMEHLRLAIEGREKVAKLFYAFRMDAGHKHIIEVLSQIRDLLLTCGKSRSGEDEGENLALRVTSMKLESSPVPTPSSTSDTTPPLSTSTTPSYTPRVAPPPSRTPRFFLEDRPLNDCLLLDDDDVDAATAAFCFLSDVERLRKYVDSVWKSVADNQISLATGSLLTSQAVEFVKQLERDLRDNIGEKFGDGTHFDAIHLMLGLDDPEQLLQLESTLSQDLLNFFSLTTLDALIKFAGVIQPGQVPLPNRAFWKPFVPSASRSRMTWKEKQYEDLALVMVHLGEIGTVALGVANSEAVQYNEVLLADTRTFVKDPRHPVPTHLVFGWTAWLSSVHACRSNLEKSAETVILTAESILESGRRWYNVPSDLYDPLSLGGFKNDVKAVLLDQLPSLMIKDTPFATVLRELAKLQNQEGTIRKHHDIRKNPWAAGCAQLKLLMAALSLGSNLIGASGTLAHTLQLYHALRIYKKLNPIPMMDRLLALCAPVIYAEGLPKMGGFVRSHTLHISGYNATTGRTDKDGMGRGVFPPRFSGSMVLELVKWRKYRLEETFVTALLNKKDLSPIPAAKMYHGRRQDGSQEVKKEWMNEIASADCAIQGRDMIAILDALKKRSEKEVAEGVLAMDLFSVELAGQKIYERWDQLSGHIFRDAYGATYQEHKFQRNYMLSWLFFGLEQSPGRKEMSTEQANEAFDLAKKAFLEVMGEVEKYFGQGGDLHYAKAVRR